MKIEIKKINLKTNTQTRTKINQNTVDEYAADLTEGAEFPAIILFQAGKDYYIADGWHRLFAYKKAGKKNILADVKPGSKRDAILYSVGSNSAHGLRRTNADKRNSVTILLNDPEWSKWSDREIARKAVVGNRLVSDMRREITVVKPQIAAKKVKRAGKEYTINTANIGQNAKKTTKKEPIEIASTMKIDNNSRTENNVSEPKKFRFFGWEIQIRKIQTEPEKKLISQSEI